LVSFALLKDFAPSAIHEKKKSNANDKGQAQGYVDFHTPSESRQRLATDLVFVR